MYVKRTRLVKSILATCLLYKLDRKEVWMHKSFLSKLSSNLLSAGFRPEMEYAVKYPFRDGFKDGRLDVYVNGGNEKVGLEFDYGVRLKYKSILKLLLSDTNVCFGVYGGVIGNNEYNKQLYMENRRRIEKIVRDYELGNLDKIFYLINFMDKRISFFRV